MPMPQYNGPMYAQGPTAVGPYNLQGYQSTFGYNPQQTYLPQTQQPQMATQQPQTPSLVGRIVTANDQIPPAEIPSNGTPAYFPMQDGSAILVKVWNGNGTINTVRYIPEPPPAVPDPGLRGAESERLLRLPAERLSVLRLLSHGKKV